VSEYFSEKEQWEELKAWIRQNGPWVLGGVALGVAVLAGWRWWQGYSDARALAAGGKYTQMIQALELGERGQGFARLGELEREYPSSPYADQGKLIAARVYVEGNELDKAAQELDTVTLHSKDRDLALVARERLARVQIAQGKPDAALATLDAVTPGSFAAVYHEVRGDAYYAKGQKALALSEYRAAQSSGQLADTSLLGLKVADLAADLPPAAAAARPAPAVTPASATASSASAK
jgi:predicted negative regulator of RcsB-dependent stress response